MMMMMMMTLKRSPSNSRWRPGLTGVSVGHNPAKKNLLGLVRLALLARLVLTHGYIDSVQYVGSLGEAHGKMKHRLLLVQISLNSSRWNPRILCNTTKGTNKPGETGEPGHANRQQKKGDECRSSVRPVDFLLSTQYLRSWPRLEMSTRDRALMTTHHIVLRMTEKRNEKAVFNRGSTRFFP